MMKPRFGPTLRTIGLIVTFGFGCAFGPAVQAQIRAQSAPWAQETTRPLAQELGARPAAQGDSAAKKPARTRRTAPRAKKREGSAKTPRSPSIRFTGTAGLQAIYDDNILRASDATILEFRQGIVPWKFKIETYDDLILSPRIGLTFGKRLLGPRETSLRIGYIRFQYARNGIKNNESWNFRLRQATQGRDFIELSYGYSPFAYIRELSDRAPFDPASSPLVWTAFKSTRSGFTLGYSRRVNERLTVRVDGGRVMRFYNQRFMENDNWEWNGTGQAAYRLSDAVRIAGQYQYSKVKARATDTVGETRLNTNDGDPSYDRDLYETTFSWSPEGKIPRVDAVDVMGQYQAYFFTSDLLYWDDPFHVGRKDRVYTVEISATTVPMIGSMTFEAGYRFSQRTSTATQQVDIADEKDYRDNRVWIGANYSF